MNKIYMSGAGGMLGEAFYMYFKNKYKVKCSDINVSEDWLSFLDFRNFQAYIKDVKEFNPDYLFHIGAHTDLEYCELNIEDAYDTNTKSVEYAVQIANDLNIPLLYISTAGIFDGKKDSFDEDDQPNPIGHYAKSKYFGEKQVQEYSKDFLICRAGWMMGGGFKKDKKFIQKIMKQILNGNKELNIVNDKLGTPTYTHDFAKNTNILIQSDKRGLYNMVCEGVTGRLEVARELLSLLNLNDKIIINEVNSQFFSREYFAERPNNERLVNRKLNNQGLNIMRDWKIALKEYLFDYYSDSINELK